MTRGVDIDFFMPKSLLYITTSVYIIIIIKLKAWNISSIGVSIHFHLCVVTRFFKKKVGEFLYLKKKNLVFRVDNLSN